MISQMIQNRWHWFRQLDRRIVTILLIVFVQMLGASMVLPILPIYAKRYFEMSPETITLLLSAFFAAQFVAGPAIGRLSDRHGRLPILIISQIGTAVSFAMIGLAGSVEMLFFARVLDGITGGNIIVAQAYITDITPRDQRTQALGSIFAVFGLGFVFGPALGGLLAAAFGITVTFLMAALAALSVVFLTYYTLDETVTPEQRLLNRQKGQATLGIRQLLANGPLTMILAMAFFGQFGLGLLQGTFALFGEDVLFRAYDPNFTNLAIGLLLSGVGVTQVITQTFVLPWALRHMDDMSIVLVGVISRSIGFLLFALAVSPAGGGVSVIFFALGSGLMMPPLQSQTTKLVAEEVRGAVLGVSQAVVSLATIFSTAVAGLLYAIAPAVPYWIGAVLTALLIFPTILLIHRLRTTETAPLLT